MRQMLAENLKLPEDASTQTYAFLGRKGSGKTYAAGKLVELLFASGVQVIVLDAVGNWYGLRLGATPAQKGLDIPILGGMRGDIPLEATGGAQVASAALESGRSLVLDISQFSKADRQRFAADFGECFWRGRKARPNDGPVHLVLEESQLIVPEFVGKDQTRMVGVYEEIIRLGRNYGIGASMISQRPQSVNKEVLNQTECLFAFQVNGTHERKALKDWVTHQGADVSLVNELPGLNPGECYVWSPQWLKRLDKIKILPKQTMDSTSTPKIGGNKKAKSELRPLDLGRLQEALKASIERSKADDPRELRKRIADLEKQLVKAQAAAPSKIVEVPVIQPKHMTNVGVLVDKVQELQAIITDGLGGVQKALAEANIKMQPSKPVSPAPMNFHKHKGTVTPGPSTQKEYEPNAFRVPVVQRKDSGIHRIMVALAQRPGLTKRQLGIRASLSSRSGTFGTYISQIRKAGYLESDGAVFRLTQLGLDVLGPYEPLPEGEALLRYWLDAVGSASGESRMLQALANGYPKALTKEEIGTAAGISHGSGTFGTYMSHLKSLELVVKVGNDYLLSEELVD